MSDEAETVRETSELGEDGRNTMPESIRKARDIMGKKAYLQWETYGKDKILLTILSRWRPSKSKQPGKDVSKK